MSNVTVGAQKPKLITAWTYGVCAIISDGTASNNIVRCWGFGVEGERGNNSTTADQSVTTVQAVGCGGTFIGATAIAAGGHGNNGSAVCAVSGGAVYCWGDNKSGELGTGSITPVSQLCPVKTLVATGATDIAGGSSAFGYCARINTGGTLRCWGSAASGFLGNGTLDAGAAPTPVAQTW